MLEGNRFVGALIVSRFNLGTDKADALPSLPDRI